jgi:SAM-dependent methyltransferase
MERMPTTTVEPSVRYPLKASPYSSHGLLLAEFPSRGEGRRILDIGCGYGHLGSFLAQRGFTVTGVDYAGIAHSPDIEFVPADLDNGLPPLDRTFDFILCADVLEHLRDPLRMLMECRGLLAPGGALIASLPNSGHAYFRYQILMGRFPQEDRGLFDRTHLRFYTWDGWVELLSRAGFAIQTLRCSGIPFAEAFPGLPMVELMERMSFASARIWKRLFAYQFIIRAVV